MNSRILLSIGVCLVALTIAQALTSTETLNQVTDVNLRFAIAAILLGSVYFALDKWMPSGSKLPSFYIRSYLVVVLLALALMLYGAFESLPATVCVVASIAVLMISHERSAE